MARRPVTDEAVERAGGIYVALTLASPPLPPPNGVNLLAMRAALEDFVEGREADGP